MNEKKVPNGIPSHKNGFDESTMDGSSAMEATRQASPFASRTGEYANVLGDFKIIREIGVGGMATVYEAEQISLKRKVALKVLPSHLTFSDKSVQMFQREAEAGGRQSHAGIVAVHAVGQHDGNYYIALELVEGGFTLENRLEEICKAGRLQDGYFDDVARFFIKTTEAMQHAHNGGVIHRDLKPSNILLTPDGQPKITDFGLARVEDALALSRTGDFAGTPYYMSPEQAMSRRIGIDHRTDIYSLGVTFYEALTLKRPFDGKTSHEILKKIVLNEPEDPRKINPRVPQDLAVICLKAMEKDPNHRYGTMAELGDDLRRFIAGDMIQAKPSGVVLKYWKRAKRNPMMSTAIVVAILAVIGLIVGTAGFMFKLSKERNNARLSEEKAIRNEKVAMVAKSLAEEERNKAVLAKEEAELQKHAAEDARRATMRQAEKFKAIYRFLDDMFSSFKPRHQDQGEVVKIDEVLDQAVEKIPDLFQDQIEIEALLRSTLGSAYNRFGLYNKGEEQHRKAFELRKSVLGEEHADTFDSLHNLACSLGKRAKYAEAESLMQKAYDGRLRILGEEHEDTLSSMSSLAALIGMRGDFNRAEEYFTKILEIRRRVKGDENPDTLSAENELAMLYQYKGKLAEAESRFRKVLSARRQTLGEDDMDTLNTKVGLALVLRDRGKYDESITIQKSVIDDYTRILGQNHPTTIQAECQLANILIRYGANADAERILKKAVERQKLILGEAHHDTLTTMHGLVQVISDQGRLDEAERIARNVLENRRKVSGENHRDTITAIYALASVLEQKGNLSEAEHLYLKAVDGYIYTLGNDHPFTLLAKSELAGVISSKNRLNNAEKAYREVLEEQRKTLGDENPDTIRTKHNLACNLSSQGKYGEAESLFRDVLKTGSVILRSKHPDIVKSLVNLIELLTLQERWSDVEELYFDLIEVYEGSKGQEHPDTLTAEFQLASVFCKQKKFEEAVGCYKKILIVQRREYGDGTLQTLETMSAFAATLKSQGDWKKAEDEMLKCYDGFKTLLGEQNAMTINALNQVIELYEQCGKMDKATEYREKLLP